MKHIRRSILLALVVGCQASGITDIFNADLPLPEQIAPPGNEARRVAMIRFYGDSERVAIPASVRVGEAVAVQLTSYGGGCITEDTTVMVASGMSATVVPYQRIYVPRTHEACTDDLRITRRTAIVSFPAAGRGTVRVIGRESPGDSLITVVRDIVVQ